LQNGVSDASEYEKNKKKEVILSEVRKELLAMEFEESLIDRALEQTSDLEKAIELIISIL
jgi:ubiquinone biosynthesis protein COQ9